MPASRCFGVDVAKRMLSVACESGAAQEIENTHEAITRWLAGVPAGSRIAVEATNTYHRLLAVLAHAAGLQVFVLNPALLAYYGKSLGTRAKTDRLDAALIARYLVREHAQLRPWQPPCATTARIRTLITRRASVVQTQVALRESLGDVDGLEDTARHLQQAFAKALKDIDAALRALVASHATLARQCTALRALPGVGPLVSTALAATLLSLPLRSADAAVAYAGLDPRTRESGTFRGQKKLSKRGPGELRRLLYVAAMTTARHPAMRDWVQRHHARGLSAVATYTVLARRLLRTAWSMLRHDTPFSMERFVGGG